MQSRRARGELLVVFLLSSALCFLAVAAAATAADQDVPVLCYTGVASLAGAEMTLANATSTDTVALRTNKRTVYAATLSAHGAEALLVSRYAGAAGLTLERFALDGGARIDSIALDRSASESQLPPARVCATNYVLALAEANGTLSLYSVVTGAKLAAPGAPAGRVRALACSSGRLFVATDADAILELAPSDGLPLARIAAQPAVVSMLAIEQPGGLPLLLRVQAGVPLLYELVLDADARTLVGTSDQLPQAVAADDALQQCVVHSVDMAHSTVETLRTGVRDPQCTAVSSDPPPLLVLSDGVLWSGSPLAAPIGGALLNAGNLGQLWAAVSCAADQVLLADADGALVRYNLATRAAERLPSLPGPPARLLAFGCDAIVWQPRLDSGVASEVMARIAGPAGPDVLLPPLGGAVGAAVLLGELACLQMERQLHCLDPAQPAAGADVIVLPDAAQAPAGFTVFVSDDALYGLASAADGSAVAVWHAPPDAAAFELLCTLDLKRAGLPPPDPAALRPVADSVLLWTAGLLVELDAANCSVVASEALADRAAGTLLAPVLGMAAGAPDCLFTAHSSRRTGGSSGTPLALALGLCAALCCFCIAIVVLAGAPAARKRLKELDKHKHSGWAKKDDTEDSLIGAADLGAEHGQFEAYSQRHWYTSPRMQTAVHLACCCAPAVKTRLLAMMASRMRSAEPAAASELYTTNAGVELSPMSFALSPESAGFSVAAAETPGAPLPPPSSSASSAAVAAAAATTATGSSLFVDDAHFSAVVRETSHK